MIYLHKLIPLLFSPFVVFLAVVCYGAIRSRKRLVLVAALLFYAASVPVVSERLFRIIEAKAVRQDPKSMPLVDGIVVLSGMLGTVESVRGVVPEWGDPDRFFGGIELYRSERSKKLIFTAGISPWQPQSVPEGFVLASYAEAMGVPRKDILVTDRAQNTEQEAAAARGLFAESTPSILLVTSAFHMPRAKLLFERAGFEVYEYPVDFKVGVGEFAPMDLAPKAEALWLTEIAVRELIGRLYYGVKSVAR